MRLDCPYPTPTAETVCSLPSLLYFVWEREVVRIVKERGGEPPYTNDPVIQRYKFTNIRRQDDRVSRWIIDNVIAPNISRKDLWFILLVTRLINWPPTLEHLINAGILFRPVVDFEPAEFSQSVENYKAQGRKVYSGAYMVYPTKMDPGGVKSLAIAKHIIAPAAKLNMQMVLAQNSISAFVSALAKSFGISTFMAGQVAADLTYCPQLGNASDLYSYAPIGPGSSKGLNYLLGRTEYATWTQGNFNEQLVKINNAINIELEITDLTLHDVQNVMCEFSKYVRAVKGSGKPKTVYQPETEF